MSDNELEKPVKSGTAPLRRARAIRWSKRAGIALAVPVFYFMALGAEKDLKAIWSDLAGGEGEATEVSSGGDTEPKSLVERMTGRDADPARSSRQSGERSASSPRTLAVNTAAGARMRARPTSRSRSVAVLALGEKVTLIERRGAWAEVRASEGEGFIERRLLSPPDSVSSSAAGRGGRGDPGNPKSYDVGDCKQYTSTIAMAGGEREVTGIACKRPDGTWNIKSRHVTGR